MTSPAFWTQSVSAVFYPAVFLHNSPALNSNARYEKNEQVHQADLFKGQTLAFIFQQKFHIHLSIYPICQVNTREWTAAIVALVVTRQNSMAAKSFLLNNTFSTLLHQTCIAVLVKYLSHHTGLNWIELRWC